eukprot:COSAG05_NODE_11200_length_525_cov_0.976526_1_plen_69_part_10
MSTVRLLALLALGYNLPAAQGQVAMVPCTNPDGTAQSGPPTCLANACVGDPHTECINDANGVVEVVQAE